MGGGDGWGRGEWWGGGEWRQLYLNKNKKGEKTKKFVLKIIYKLKQSINAIEYKLHRKNKMMPVKYIEILKMTQSTKFRWSTSTSSFFLEVDIL